MAITASDSAAPTPGLDEESQNSYVSRGSAMIAVDRKTDMETTSKERLHRLVDALPADELLAAECHLQFLSANGDPLVQALMDAPEDPEPLSDADRQVLEEGRAALEAGDTVSDDEFCAELKI